jgi:16S rRNA (cytosine967-C5)-methyltransferase
VASPERRLALAVILDVGAGRVTLGERLARGDVERLPARDRALLHELVLGTLRHRGLLDHALARASERPLARIDPGVLDALRLGAYQVLKLRVPDHAAVSETVDLARSVEPKAGGFVNAVLRRLAREGSPSVPDPAGDALGWLTTEGSLPQWLAERWLARDGAETAIARARAFLSPAPPTFRLNPRRPDAASAVEAAGLAPVALELPGTWEATAGRSVDLARAGVLFLQDLGSQLVAHLAAADGRVLDACAAPGGKALLMADVHPGSRVIALEISPRRLQAMKRLVGLWGADNVTLVAADAGRPPFGEAVFDSVLLDAPCSGLGTLGRNPDIRWRLQASEVARHAERQRRLILSVADRVRPGGRLVYSACTLEPEETDDVVAAFLAARTDFRLSAPAVVSAPFVEGDVVRVRPERHRADGFFAAVFTRANLTLTGELESRAQS